MRFSKAPKDIADQVALLKQRGMVIDDPDLTETLLENIGYYRFSAYTFPFRTGANREVFKVGTTLQQVIRVYDFDRELRLLVADAIERVEVGIRSRLVNQCSLHYQDGHWFMDAKKFHPNFNHRAFLRKLEQQLEIQIDPKTQNRILPSKHPETFVEHYYQKYGDPYLPPFWMSAEILTLGSLSHLFKGLGDSKLKKDIAAPFGVPAKMLASWLHSVAHLRNVCAHHGRLWNRKFSISPPVTKKHQGILHHPHRFEGQSVVLVDLLDVCAPTNQWRKKFTSLLADYPEIDPQAMGYPSSWTSEPFWNTSSS